MTNLAQEIEMTNLAQQIIFKYLFQSQIAVIVNAQKEIGLQIIQANK